MSARLHNAVTIGISIGLMASLSLQAAANPLFASPEQRQSV